MSTPRKWTSASDYTQEEQELFAKIFQEEAVSNHVAGIKELDLRGRALDLQDDLEWVDGLQDENDRLYDEKGKLEEKILDLGKQLSADNRVDTNELANLRVELQQAHIIIKGMIVKYRGLKERVEARRQARTTGPGVVS